MGDRVTVEIEDHVAEVTLNRPEKHNAVDLAMFEALSAKLAGQMHEGWLDLITVKDDEGLHQYKAPVFAIWGGYGGASD